MDEFLASGDQMMVDLEDLLQRDPETGRDVLRTLLTTPITVTPRETADGVAFEYSAQARLDGPLAGCLPGSERPGRVTKSNTTKLVAPGGRAYQWTANLAININGSLRVFPNRG